MITSFKKGSLKKLATGLFITAAFIVAYNTLVAQQQPCHAIDPPPPIETSDPPDVSDEFCDTKKCKKVDPCVDPGKTSELVTELIDALKDNLTTSATTLEKYLSNLDDSMMYALLVRLNNTEHEIIRWWQTLESYNLNPAMRRQTSQLTTGETDKARTLASGYDAAARTETVRKMQEQELADQRAFRVPESACPPATMAGGFARAEGFGRGMMKAWEIEAQQVGYNKKGIPGDDAAAEAEKKRADDYENAFCDPNANGGNNKCLVVADEKYKSADTKPTEVITEQLTIPVHKDPKLALTVSTILNNMTGVPSADPIGQSPIESSEGQRVFLNRRAYLARHSALRTVPQMVAGWRQPGSRMDQWVKDLRGAAGVPLSQISDNPSYKEIMHAMAVDRFNSGEFMLGKITDQSELEMEKLTQDVFYLMLLRDYHDLLERTALTLAVQVAVMADEAAPSLPDTNASVPFGKP